jgi:hypothetical protein
MNRYKYYFINQYSLTIKNIFPIISLLFYNEFTEKLNKDYIVRYTLIALCSILNEREDVIRLLKKDIMGEFNENLIENIRLTILTILELYKKIEKKDIYYLDIFKDTRNFISFLIIMFEFIKQNNFKYIDFIKYKDNIDNVILDKIKKKYNNINK